MEQDDILIKEIKEFKSIKNRKEEVSNKFASEIIDSLNNYFLFHKVKTFFARKIRIDNYILYYKIIHYEYENCIKIKIKYNKKILIKFETDFTFKYKISKSNLEIYKIDVENLFYLQEFLNLFNKKNKEDLIEEKERLNYQLELIKIFKDI